MIYSTIIVSFSSRKDGNSSKTAEYAASFYKNSVKIYRFEEFFIHPCGGCTYQCFREGTECPYYQDMEAELLEQICASENAVFIVPNYCDHPCANFYIFNERSNCWFQNKPERLERYLKVRKKFLVISKTESDSFRRAFEQHVEEEPNILYVSAKKYGLGSSTEDLLQSEAARADILEFLKTGPEGG